MKSILAFSLGIALTAVAFVVAPFVIGVPESEFVSVEAIAAKQKMTDEVKEHLWDFVTGDLETINRLSDKIVFNPHIDQAREHYAVDESSLVIDGVYTEVFVPSEGVSEKNAQRVLINLHGGAFAIGARTGGRLESIPIASVAKIKVISVDYRQSPDHQYPAATEDVLTVYQYLLQSYAPENIGIYGCSAGGLLTAQAIASMIKQKLPVPGAAGVFCAGAGQLLVGDGMRMTKAMGIALPNLPSEYFKSVDWGSAEAAPINHPEVLAEFPPTMIVTSTRDFVLSASLVMHQRLLEQGVTTALHVYEGLDHAFFYHTITPESKAHFKQVAHFFDAHLAQRVQPL